jgi:hypothetical protein
LLVSGFAVGAVSGFISLYSGTAQSHSWPQTGQMRMSMSHTVFSQVSGGLQEWREGQHMNGIGRA